MGGLGQCIICWDAGVNAVGVPCGHLCCCFTCLASHHKKKRHCPVCRAPMREVIRVYPGGC